MKSVTQPSSQLLFRLFALILFVFAFQVLPAQFRNGFLQKHPDRDLATHSIGFSAGANLAIDKITYSDGAANQIGGQITDFFTATTPGFQLGAFYRYRFNDAFSVRVNPMVALTSHTLSDTVNLLGKLTRQYESVQLWVPLHLIMEKQLKNSSPYLLFGGAIKRDITNSDSHPFTYSGQDFAIESGLGWNFFGDKVSAYTELIYAVGLTDQISSPSSGLGSIQKVYRHNLRLNIGFF